MGLNGGTLDAGEFYGINFQIRVLGGKMLPQALGWRSEGRFYTRMDDISSVAFWYQEGINNKKIDIPSRDELEII